MEASFMRLVRWSTFAIVLFSVTLFAADIKFLSTWKSSEAATTSLVGKKWRPWSLPRKMACESPERRRWSGTRGARHPRNSHLPHRPQTGAGHGRTR